MNVLQFPGLHRGQRPVEVTGREVEAAPSNGSNPPVQEGFLDLPYTLVTSPYNGLNFKDLATAPTLFYMGMLKGWGDVLHSYAGGKPKRAWPYPERRVTPFDDHDRVSLVTGPDPKRKINPRNATVNWGRTGLGELDMASALIWHMAQAEENPEDFTVTLTMPSVSSVGRSQPVGQALNQPLEKTAEEDLSIVRGHTQELNGGGRVNFSGVSLGSVMTILIARMNNSANPHDKLEVVGLDLISDAVGAKGMDEVFGVEDQSYEAFLHKVQGRFKKHVRDQIPNVGLRHPEQAGRIYAGMVGTYAVQFWLLANRLAAINSNYDGASQGLDLKSEVAAVFESHDRINLLSGEDDSLFVDLLEQKKKLKEMFPHINWRVLAGLGHLMTVNAPYVAAQLGEMKKEVPAPRRTVALAAVA